MVDSPKTWKKGWTSEQEAAFREWYSKWAQRIGANPNPDAPVEPYDFREAYIKGLEPQWQEEKEKFQWPELVKSPLENQAGFERNRINQGAKVW